MESPETFLAMHVNPWAYLLLLLAAVAGFLGAAAQHQAVKGSGLDTDDSPSGWSMVGASLFIVAGLIAASASGIQYESQQLADKALTKYGVSYVEESAKSQVAHLVLSKATVRAIVDGQEVALTQEVEPRTHEVTLRFVSDGVELPRREQ